MSVNVAVLHMAVNYTVTTPLAPTGAAVILVMFLKIMVTHALVSQEDFLVSLCKVCL